MVLVGQVGVVGSMWRTTTYFLKPSHKCKLVVSNPYLGPTLASLKKVFCYLRLFKLSSSHSSLKNRRWDRCWRYHEEVGGEDHGEENRQESG